MNTEKSQKNGENKESISETGQFELRSEQVHEILSFIPHWIVRWGITIFFITILMFLLATWIIRYPDIIQSRITITTKNPPVSFIARTSGKLVLLVKENDFVNKDTYLAAIENPAKIDDVFQLKSQMDAFKTIIEKQEESINFIPFKNTNFGELEIYYSLFLQSYSNYEFFNQTNYQFKKIKSIEDQIIYYKDLNKRLIGQKKILFKEVELAQKKYKNNKILFEKGLISEVQLANIESEYLQKKYALENAKNSIINSNIQLAEYQKNIMDLKQHFNDKKRGLILSIQQAYKNLQSQYAIWEQKYIFKAPIEGKVSFFKYWSDNQFVNVGDEVMTIVPNSHNILGKIYLPAFGSGKVQIGQKVNIKFDRYPFREFGIVDGKIQSISLIARNNQYLIDVSLPKGLLTSYNKTLEFKQEMQGNAEIITDNLRIIERIFNQLRSVFHTSLSE